MDELKEIERKIVTAQSMSDIRAVFSRLKYGSLGTAITQKQVDAMLIVSQRDGVTGAIREIDMDQPNNRNCNPNAIMAKIDNGFCFAGTADDIVRGGK